MATKNAVVPWAERLGALAEAAAAAEVVSGSFISFKAGQMTFGNAPIAGNSLNCVILDSVFENTYYTEVWNPNVIVSPVCFAFGRADDEGNRPEMAPHNDSETKQNDTCEGCPQNAWGSDPKGGRGKACKEIRRLAVIPADALKDPSKIGPASVAYMRIPVMSVPNWSGYVNHIAIHKRPAWSVITKVWPTPDAKSQFRVNFELVGAITDDATLNALWEKVNAQLPMTLFPYSKSEEAPPPQPKTAVKAARKSKIG